MMMAYPKRALAAHERETETVITEPQDDTQTCVKCGAKVARSAAYRVTVRVWTPANRSGSGTTWTTGGRWSHSMTWYPGTYLNGNWNTPTVFPEPTHEAHEFTGYACSREHAEQAAETKTHYGE